MRKLTCKVRNQEPRDDAACYVQLSSDFGLIYIICYLANICFKHASMPVHTLKRVISIQDDERIQVFFSKIQQVFCIIDQV